jgi:hypothetical protein
MSPLLPTAKILTEDPTHKVIVCILPQGEALPIMDSMVKERGITRADVCFARGTGRLSPLRRQGIGQTSEKEIMTLLVPIDTAEEIFSALYHLTGMHDTPGYFMYMHSAHCTTSFKLPEVTEE